jgi:hypothetical protein
MNSKKIVTIFLLLFVAVSIFFLIGKETNTGKSEMENHTTETITAGNLKSELSFEETGEKVIVYYFHGNKRCGGCGLIESYSKETVDVQFAEELSKGTVQWVAVNVENPENRHYVEEYELYGPSLLLAHYKDGKKVEWKNLDQVWTLSKNKTEFIKYVETELRNFAGEING